MKTVNVKTRDLRSANSALRAAINGVPVMVKNSVHLHGLAAGFSHGEIIIEGDSGDYLGVLNAGATIRVTGNAGNYLADNMSAGEIVVEGSAGFGAGQYCYGGVLVIRGDAGDFTATMNKGAVIVVEGNVGDEAGTYMLKGDLIIIGGAGENFANYLIRGSIFIGGEWKSLGHNTRVELLTDEDLMRLKEIFQTYNIRAVPAGFKKIVAASEKPFYH